MEKKRISMMIFKVTPTNLNSPHWAASTYREEVLIRAENKHRAMLLASASFFIAALFTPFGEPAAINPWNETTGVVTITEVFDSGFELEGEEAILS